MFSDETLSTQIDPGTFPPLIRTGRFVLRLKRNGAGTFRCHALNLDGTRERELPVESDGDSIRLDIDTSQFEYGTPFFELER
ncbi:hypothetical protein SDC9_203242 [bioreactor metagenome]|uniref:Uncharacterized protein n=1 Tax=bioreactor metagenome TaxID=1076179 RepID=A0A645IVW7_9ZZZZ